MPAPKLDSTLIKEYNTLFNNCEITSDPDKAGELSSIIMRIQSHQERYASLQSKTNVPWFVSAVIHNMECSLNFNEHLHNGDSLQRRTVNVPAGRPKNGQPPFDWEVSAIDALQYDNFISWGDWSLAGICYKLEGYNGWGYRAKEINTPYLWSYSNQYTSGKYIADGIWSDTAVSRQCGAAVILRRLAELGTISFDDQPVQPPKKLTLPTTISYSMFPTNDSEELEKVEDLQRLLNQYPGIFVKVDGVPGNQTSEAYKEVTGNYLDGDPRA